MSSKAGVLQVCVSCKRPRAIDPDTANDEAKSADATSESCEGQQLFEALQNAFGRTPDLDEAFSVEPVECMNGCQSSCTVALRAQGKFGFVIGQLDPSEERIADIVSFTQSFHEAENGLPPWRARPPHVRKNTLVRLHPSPNFSERSD
ncbi:Predicted metal-binding protein [Cohaesibacter sp. ES.047]|uniref:DUF1636 family protein n=1 Tax=Cohaesibacter sp. ES.047 TaxID=1798205 RepID=UPI000BB8D418|nr:DUF1636 domain-containing protein [Cohaesibacter sp. ES.047]SNY93543.1 Predicted metal-binding protein [Cohaesibacter sp. ES.047]